MPSSHLTDELNGPQWFDATKFPNATFVSTSIKMRGQNDATIHGNLTLHGVTSPVSVQAACVLLERFVERGAGRRRDPAFCSAAICTEISRTVTRKCRKITQTAPWS